jgi:hypothetical protein
MAKLTYWVARHEHDSECYSLIGKTKKSVQEQLANAQLWNPQDYGPIEKRVIEYRDAFDLFDWVTSEGGGRASSGVKA